MEDIVKTIGLIVMAVVLFAAVYNFSIGNIDKASYGLLAIITLCQMLKYIYND